MINATAYSPNGLLYEAYGVTQMNYGLEVYFKAWILHKGYGYQKGFFETRSEAMEFAEQWASTFD